MSPHDQQLAVSSPPPAAAIVLDVSIVMLDGVARAPSPATAESITKILRNFQSLDRKMLAERGGPCRSRLLAGEGARSTQKNYPENDVPQPQDFDALGLTNTNPCCIRVS